jgi:hypothetical protein
VDAPCRVSAAASARAVPARRSSRSTAGACASGSPCCAAAWTTSRRRGRLHRAERSAAPIPTVALVGYTNAGKSTLMNTLTQAGVLVEDRLFATLDPTVRRLRLPGGLAVALADTVGFIHKLPHQLIEAFKSTLEQVRTADLLLHVIDVSHPSWEEHRRVVDEVLEEIGAGDVPRLAVLNKQDLLPPGETPLGLPADGVRGLGALRDRRRPPARRDRGRALARPLPDQARAAVGARRPRRDAPARRPRARRYYRDGTVVVTALVPTKVAGQVQKALGARL